MNEWLEIGLSFSGGVLLGLLYFGGLWWTVARFQTADSPVGFYLTSLVIRTAVLFLCLFLLLRIGAVEMLVALSGFFIVRMVMVRRYGLSSEMRFKQKTTS